MHPTRCPICASAVATCIETVDLPAPPFSLPTTMICATAAASCPILPVRTWTTPYVVEAAVKSGERGRGRIFRDGRAYPRIRLARPDARRGDRGVSRARRAFRWKAVSGERAVARPRWEAGLPCAHRSHRAAGLCHRRHRREAVGGQLPALRRGACEHRNPDGPALPRPSEARFQAESGLHQNWMRDYDPTTGRYNQADPLGLVDGASVYGYALQNPLRWVDPRGEWTWGFPSKDEHYNRNRNNWCPNYAPIRDGFGFVYDSERGKWRHELGWECKYDPCGELMEDTVVDGEQNYSYNYGGGTEPWSPSHIWKDVIPHYFYGNPEKYGQNQTDRHP
ncbi:MAG: RHS repeat-associated core domain-containing protein [Rhodobacteraceae bacterium]|nr:RHS repeat-associated core domain-containing protein [Paracoccaceae bacterium]